MGTTKKLPTPLDKNKLFRQKGFQSAVKDSEHPDFDVENIFDHCYCPTAKGGGGEIKTAPKKKKKNRDKMIESFSKKSNSGNYSTFYKYERF
jgi:hypothetical protein